MDNFSLLKIAIDKTYRLKIAIYDKISLENRDL
jgi:hypothetical protein